MDVKKNNNFTIKCKHVFRRKNGFWNKCKKREFCKFAHTLEEIKYLDCNNDLNCKNYISNGICLYKHSNETRDEWIERTKILRPEIPIDDNELSSKSNFQPKIKEFNSIPTELNFIENVSQFISKKIEI